MDQAGRVPYYQCAPCSAPEMANALLDSAAALRERWPRSSLLNFNRQLFVSLPNRRPSGILPPPLQGGLASPTGPLSPLPDVDISEPSEAYPDVWQEALIKNREEYEALYRWGRFNESVLAVYSN